MQGSSDHLRAQTVVGSVFSLLDTLASYNFMQQISSERVAEMQEDVAALPPSTIDFVISRMFATRPEEKLRVANLVTAARQAAASSAQAELKSANPMQPAKTEEEQPLGDDAGALPQKVEPMFHSKYYPVSV